MGDDGALPRPTAHLRAAHTDADNVPAGTSDSAPARTDAAAASAQVEQAAGGGVMRHAGSFVDETPLRGVASTQQGFARPPETEPNTVSRRSPIPAGTSDKASSPGSEVSTDASDHEGGGEEPGAGGVAPRSHNVRSRPAF